jgi:type IV pilus assembly protein PilM
VAGRPVVGLDIGSSGVRAAELSFGKGGSTLERFGQVALAPGAVRDGEVVDTEAVAEALRQLWARVRFSTKKVVVGVANQKVVVRQVDLPWLPPDEMRASLSFQVQDYIPMPVDQAILDYHPLEELTGEGDARLLRVLLVAASREMVGTTLEAVEKAGLVPSMVDLTSFAVLRSLGGQTSGLGLESEALVDIGATVTNIVVHQAGVPRFVRILLMGGADITDAVAERMGITLDQAEQVKQASGLADGTGAPDHHPLARVLESSGSAFVEEVRGSLDYYATQSGSARISRVVLSGGGSLLGGLAQRLSVATRLPVTPARPISQLQLGRTGLTDAQLAFVEPMASVPVGLALGMAS